MTRDAPAPELKPDLEAFHRALVGSVVGRNYSGEDVAGDFRQLFLREPDALGRRVLFMLLSWCGEYDAPPAGNDDLQRWAGRREIATQLKAALYADLTTPPSPPAS